MIAKNESGFKDCQDLSTIPAILWIADSQDYRWFAWLQNQKNQRNQRFILQSLWNHCIL